MSTRHAVFSCSDVKKKKKPKVLNCELSRLLRHLPIDEINHKMFCPESSLSLFTSRCRQGGKGEFKCSFLGKIIQISPPFTFSQVN